MNQRFITFSQKLLYNTNNLPTQNPLLMGADRRTICKHKVLRFATLLKFGSVVCRYWHTGKRTPVYTFLL